MVKYPPYGNFIFSLVLVWFAGSCSKCFFKAGDKKGKRFKNCAKVLHKKKQKRRYSTICLPKCHLFTPFTSCDIFYTCTFLKKALNLFTFFKCCSFVRIIDAVLVCRVLVSVLVYRLLMAVSMLLKKTKYYFFVSL